MFELKLLTKIAVPKALERAERYRFLNEPGEAESICMDVLRVEPDNQKAWSRFCSRSPISSSTAWTSRRPGRS